MVKSGTTAFGETQRLPRAPLSLSQYRIVPIVARFIRPECEVVHMPRTAPRATLCTSTGIVIARHEQDDTIGFCTVLHGFGTAPGTIHELPAGREFA